MFSQFIKTATANDSEKDREEILQWFQLLKLKKTTILLRKEKPANISVLWKAAFYSIRLMFLMKKKPRI